MKKQLKWDEIKQKEEYKRESSDISALEKKVEQQEEIQHCIKEAMQKKAHAQERK